MQHVPTSICVSFIFILILLPGVVMSATLEVGPSGYPYTRIQDAVDAANSGDTVLVHNGTYIENVTVSGNKSITIRSANGANATIIDGNHAGTVFFIGGSGSVVIDGFTIKNGQANFGAGIRVWWEATADIRNCIITANSAAWYGGGIYSESSSVTVSKCTITHNSAGDGGGVYVNDDTAIVISNSVLQSNDAGCQGATFGARGGAIYVGEGASAEITGCDIAGNNAKNYYAYSDLGFGGGVYAGINSTLTIKDSFIRMNTAFNRRSSSEGKGGGIYSDGTFSIINSVVYDNTAGDSQSPGSGGGIYLWWDSPEARIINCTITSNRALSGKGAGLFFHGVIPEVFNTIFWWNLPDSIGHYVSYAINITYCDIEGGGYAGIGNIEMHPIFSDADFHLRHDSPCINAGTATGAPEYDYEGDPRLASVGGDGEPDMGADEYIPAMPDLVVESIVFTPPTPEPASPFSAMITVRNQGNADTGGGFSIGLNGLQSGLFMNTCSCSSIEAGGTGSCSISYEDGKAAGSYSVRACADCNPIANYNNVIAESDEQNNSLDATLNVVAPDDNDPPQPDPMTWAAPPHGISTTAVSMTASAGTDASPPVEYLFDCIATGCHPSDWQTDTTYTDIGLSPNTRYGWSVMARDSSPNHNHTAYSTANYDYTDIETPSGVAFDLEDTGSTYLKVKVANMLSNLSEGQSGLIIYNLTTGVDSGWKQDNEWWMNDGLNPNTSYQFQAKARNGYGRETPLTQIFMMFTSAAQPGTAPFSNITESAITVNWTANGNPEGLNTEYYCENMITHSSSGWITGTSWTDTGLQCFTSYTYRVKARNAPRRETEWTYLGSHTTLKCPHTCRGDFHHDGDVDGEDLYLLLRNFKQPCLIRPCYGDLNTDGVVDEADLKIFAKEEYGREDCD